MPRALLLLLILILISIAGGAVPGAAQTTFGTTLESPVIARGLDEQQLRDLPRNSRDLQDFLTLNPDAISEVQVLPNSYSAEYGGDHDTSRAD